MTLLYSDVFLFICNNCYNKWFLFYVGYFGHCPHRFCSLYIVLKNTKHIQNKESGEITHKSLRPEGGGLLINIIEPLWEKNVYVSTLGFSHANFHSIYIEVRYITGDGTRHGAALVINRFSRKRNVTGTCCKPPHRVMDGRRGSRYSFLHFYIYLLRTACHLSRLHFHHDFRYSVDILGGA
jgi:hypothetical protein